jgi:hypothetical protein
MTVPASTRRSSVYEGNDSATSFAFSFKVFAAADIAVYITDADGDVTTGTLDSDYSVTLNGDQSVSPGGSITYPLSGDPLATGATLVIVGALPYTQTLAIPGGGNFNPVALENALDRLEMQIQQLADGGAGGNASTLRVPTGETVPALGSAVLRASKLLSFDADGDPEVVAPADGSAASLAISLANDSLSTEGAGQVGFNHTQNYAAGTLGWHARSHVSVLDYFTQAEITDWLDGSPTLDHTAAFNRATLATTAFASTTVLRVIDVPGGNYNIAGTVYVRKGQHLRGAGGGATRIVGDVASTVPMFLMGWGLISAVETQDAGGLPPRISGIHVDGTSATDAVIDTGGTPGFFLDDLFLTNVGLGLAISGSDGVINRVIIDQPLTGISVTASQNIVFSDLLLYSGNYHITIGSSCYDVQFSNVHMEYPQYAGVLFAESATNIKNISFNGGQALLNVQTASFLGFVHYRTGDVDDSWANFSFRNMKGYAVTHGTGIGGTHTYDGCIFDGLKTNPTYAQSTTAGAFQTANEQLYLNNCHFRNLNVYGITQTGADVSIIEVSGGSWLGIGGVTNLVNLANTNATSRFVASGMKGDGITALVNAQATVQVKLKGNQNWLGAQVSGSGQIGVKVPYQLGNQWLVTVRANPSVVGDSNYRHTATFAVQKQNTFDGALKEEALTQANVLVAPANGLTAISMQLDIGAIGAGATITNLSTSGYAFMTVASATFTSVEFEVEPLI